MKGQTPSEFDAAVRRRHPELESFSVSDYSEPDPAKPTVLHLSWLVVRRGRRNRGVGTQVMLELITYADSQGYDELTLNVASPSKHSHMGTKAGIFDFYRRFGFYRPHRWSRRMIRPRNAACRLHWPGRRK